MVKIAPKSSKIQAFFGRYESLKICYHNCFSFKQKRQNSVADVFITCFLLLCPLFDDLVELFQPSTLLLQLCRNRKIFRNTFLCLYQFSHALFPPLFVGYILRSGLQVLLSLETGKGSLCLQEFLLALFVANNRRLRLSRQMLRL